MLKLDKLNVSDPNAFWKEINKLGPRKEGIPWKVELEDGTVLLDREQILTHWTDCFQQLYKNESSGDYDDEFLGGLSLHLNHLIGSGMTNYNWQFGTLPFGIFWSNLDTMDLETYPGTYSGHF